MLVLAVDTATTAVTAGLVSLQDGAVRTLAARISIQSRGHAELLTPLILECLAEAKIARSDLAAVVAGVGPGPFTGLRVGMATAAAFGDALVIPVHGVCSLDAIAADVRNDKELLVVTDARRREVYWARYRFGTRVEGPGVCAPSAVEIGDAELIAGSPSHVDLFDLPVDPVESPSPHGLVAVAAEALLAGRAPQPLEPLYLRRPDAVEPVR